jgi:hypothetical protein
VSFVLEAPFCLRANLPEDFQGKYYLPVLQGCISDEGQPSPGLFTHGRKPVVIRINGHFVHLTKTTFSKKILAGVKMDGYNNLFLDMSMLRSGTIVQKEMSLKSTLPFSEIAKFSFKILMRAMG